MVLGVSVCNSPGKTRIREPKFKNLQPEISQLILSKNGFVKQVWPLTDCTASRSDL